MTPDPTADCTFAAAGVTGRIEFLRRWAEAVPRPLAVAVRRRAAELELLAVARGHGRARAA